MGYEARIVQIDFNAAFDSVNHHGILFQLCFVGVGGSVLSVLTQFLSNRSQYVGVDGCRSKLVNVVSGVPQGSVLGPQLFLLYTAELFSIVENKHYGYTWILGVSSKQLRLLRGRVGDSTIVVKSLSPQMSELVEDAIAS